MSYFLAKNLFEFDSIYVPTKYPSSYPLGLLRCITPEFRQELHTNVVNILMTVHQENPDFPSQEPDLDFQDD